MKFFSRSEVPESIAQDDFPKEIPQYEMQITYDKDTKQIQKTLVESEEKINIYDKIQADNHGLTVQELIKRYTAGDPNVKIGVIDWKDGDFTGATASLVEMQSIIDNFGATWDSLPLEVREHYDHDLTKFLNGVDTGEYNKFIAEKTKNDITPDNTPNPNKED